LPSFRFTFLLRSRLRTGRRPVFEGSRPWDTSW
jgi:hypothetical protein